MSNYSKLSHKPMNVHIKKNISNDGRPNLRNRRKENLLSDAFLMGLLHFIFFFGYVVLNTNSSAASGTSRSYELDKRNHFHRSNEKQKQEQHRPSGDYTYEPNYPKKNRLQNFPTLATEKEIVKHDRYLVHSMLYTEMLDDAYLKQHWTLPSHSSKSEDLIPSSKEICINIMMKNRAVPYINALITTLMMSHEGEEKNPQVDATKGAGYGLLSFADLNLLDVERKNWNYDDVRENVRRLPFLKLHCLYEIKKSWLSLLRDLFSRGVEARAKGRRKLEQIEDYLESAKICARSGLQWCLMMEEYTVVPITFLESLKKFVISPLESHFERSIESEISVVSLFSAYNSKLGSTMKIHDGDYSSSSYENDRSKLNSERRALNLNEYIEEYDLHQIVDSISQGDTEIVGGFNTAMLFPTCSVRDKLIPMLEELKVREERRFQLSPFQDDDQTISDVLDVEREFSAFTGVKPLHVEPSLVNRIGFYDDEQSIQMDTATRSEGFGVTNWLTDPRFLFEEGEYWEGAQEYCQLESQDWIWDALYYNSDRSCCDPKDAEDTKCKE